MKGIQKRAKLLSAFAVIAMVACALCVLAPATDADSASAPAFDGSKATTVEIKEAVTNDNIANVLENYGFSNGVWTVPENGLVIKLSANMGTKDAPLDIAIDLKGDLKFTSANGNQVWITNKTANSAVFDFDAENTVLVFDGKMTANLDNGVKDRAVFDSKTGGNMTSAVYVTNEAVLNATRTSSGSAMWINADGDENKETYLVVDNSTVNFVNGASIQGVVLNAKNSQITVDTGREVTGIVLKNGSVLDNSDLKSTAVNDGILLKGTLTLKNESTVVASSTSDNKLGIKGQADATPSISIDATSSVNATVDSGITVIDDGATSVDTVDKAIAALGGDAKEVTLTAGTISSESNISVNEGQKLVIGSDVKIEGSPTLTVATEGSIEITSSAKQTFSVKGGTGNQQTVTFTDIVGDIAIRGGSVHVSGDFDGKISGNNMDNVYVEGVITGDVEFSGTGKVYFKDTTIASGAEFKLGNGIDYTVQGDLRLYGNITYSGDASNTATITVNDKNTFTGYSGAVIGKNVAINGNGKIDLGACMYTSTWSNDIVSDFTTSQSQRLIIDGSLTIVSGSTLKILGELVIDEGVTITIQKDAHLIVGDTGITAIGVTVNGAVVVEESGHFDVKNASSVTVTGSIESDGELSISSNITVKEGGNIAVNDSTGSKITVTDGKDFVVENGGQVTVSKEMTVSSIINKGTVTLDGAVLSGTSKIVLAADGATVNLNSFQTTTGSSLTVTDSGMIVGKDNAKKDIVIGKDSYANKENNVYFDANDGLGIEGMVITEGVTSEKIDGVTKYTNTTYISGNVDLVDERTGTAVSEIDYTFEIKGNTSITVAEGQTLNLGDNVIMQINGGNFDVAGEVIATGETATQNKVQIALGGNTADVNVSGMITSSEELAPSMMNAFHYQGTDANKFEYYTTLNTAVANSATKIDYSGTVTVSADVTVPSGTTLSNGQKAEKIYIGSTEDRDVTVTFAAGSTSRVSYDVYATLVFDDYKKTYKSGTILSDVSVDESPKMTFTNIYTALDNTESGEVKITRQAGSPVVLDRDITVQSGVTLVIPAGNEIYMFNDVTMTIDGTVENSGKILSKIVDPANKEQYTDGAGFNPGTAAAPNEHAAAIVVNGAYKSIQETAYDAYYIPGAYYQIVNTDGSWYYITPVEQAAAVSDSVENGAIGIFGTNAVSDVTFTGDANQRVTVTLDQTAKLTANVTLSRASLDANAGQFDGTVSSAVGSVSFVNMKGFVVSDSVDEENVETFSVRNGDSAPAQADEDGADAAMTVVSGVMTVTSNLDVNGCKFSIGTDATVTVTGSGVSLTATKMTVDGTLVATNNGTVAVTNLTVRGTLNIMPQSEDKKTPAGNANITNLYVGIADKTENGAYKYFGDESAATVTAQTLGSNLALVAVSAESTISGAAIENLDHTEFYVEDAIWMTVYAKNQTSFVTAGTAASYSFQPADLQTSEFKSWKNAEGKVITTTANIGAEGYEKVYAEIDYNVYNVTVRTDGGIASVAIDGILLTNVLGGNQFSIDGLTAGQHTVTYTLKSGFTGSATLTADGIAVSGNTFTLSGDFKDASGNPIEFYLNLAGTEPSQSTVVIEGGNGDSGMGLTDYLLIVLVVLIVIMAIIVAMRLMRS